MAHRYSSINALILASVATLTVAGATACQNTARGLKQDAKEAEEQTRDERAEATKAARDLGSDAARGVERAAKATGEASEEVAERVGAALETVDVKTALMADPAVDATRIDVDTDYKTRTVTLSGYVPTATERDMAEVIAQGHAKAYRVVNKIVVRPR